MDWAMPAWANFLSGLVVTDIPLVEPLADLFENIGHPLTWLDRKDLGTSVVLLL